MSGRREAWTNACRGREKKADGLPSWGILGEGEAVEACWASLERELAEGPARSDVVEELRASGALVAEGRANQKLDHYKVRRRATEQRQRGLPETFQEGKPPREEYRGSKESCEEGGGLLSVLGDVQGQAQTEGSGGEAGDHAPVEEGRGAEVRSLPLVSDDTLR